ncbi:MAG TPA: branched-chain amino acid ABC transporter permease [Methylomirabilota bacterium]|nr:branched-chain amino acid ABC transporter permease [Methylomirabilota bacterium]
MLFFVSLLVDGMLAGAIYALISLAFVVVYKSSRMINFALGEWAMVGSRMTATGLHAAGLGLTGAVAGACLGLVALSLLFNRIVVRRLAGRPLISLVMVTLGLGALIRGAAPLVFGAVPRAIPLPIPAEPLEMYGVLVSTEKLVAAVFAAGSIAVVAAFFRWSRTGLALRAISDDQQVAMAMGIDVHQHAAVTWAIVGVLSVLSGTLWTFASGGAFGVVIIGLKVLPIVIIGGLDSIPGVLIGAALVGVLESLAAGYVDPLLGGGFSSIASYLVLIGMLFARPSGVFGRPAIERV